MVGLDADGEVALYDLEAAVGPAAWWWSAPRAAGCPGWSARPATCGCRIPMTADTESLNAGVAAAVTLAEVARRRRSSR